MLNLDENALICDLAETYSILDYRSLPVKLVAALSAGLRDNARIKMLLAKMPVEADTLLLAMIADRIELFRYGFSNNKGKEAPVSIVEMLYNGTNSKEKGVTGFASPQEFEAALARLRGE